MTSRETILTGGVIGLLASSIVLTLLWFGVVGVLGAGAVDYTYVLYPSWGMLVVGWCTTVSGITITVISVAINCALYAAIALLLRGCVLLILLPFRKSAGRKMEGL